MLLTDRVAVVTGGGSGIGRGIANGFAAFGAKVAIWEKNPETSAAAAKEVGGLSIPTDVRDAGEVDAALEQTVTELGPVSILVNNAGGVFSSPLLETRRTAGMRSTGPISSTSSCVPSAWRGSWSSTTSAAAS